MIIDFWVVAASLAGGLAGLGVYLGLATLRTPQPALGPALRRLHASHESSSPFALRDMVAAPAGQWWSSFQPPRQDLSILGRSAQGHLLSVVAGAVAVMALPALVSVAVLILRLPVTPAVPMLVTLAFAAAGGYVVDREMRARARAARGEFIRALCTYVTLAAHQVRAGHGAVEAMERAARICRGWPYVRLRTALLTAQLQMIPPWDELQTLAADIGVDELSAFADIMRSAGSDGAQVYQTLRAQAGSLRDQTRVRALEVAKKRSSKLDIPATMLIMVLLVLAVFPVMANLFRKV